MNRYRQALLFIGEPDLEEDGFQARGRSMLLFGGKGGGGGSAPAPDPRIGEAAIMNAKLGEEYLNFAREQFSIGNERQEAMDALTGRVIEQQLATQDKTNANARKDRQRYESVFLPLQDRFIDEAGNYASQDRLDNAAAEARADVLSSAQAQREINQRQMASMGINPASGRFQGIERATDLNTALAAAGAQNGARQMRRDRALALQADAINIGAGLPSQTASSYGLGLNAGNSATGNSAQANNNFRANVGIMNQGFGGAMQGYGNQANILNSLYGNQLNAFNAQQQARATSAAGLSSAAGTLAGVALF